jgi:hypothetical protein
MRKGIVLILFIIGIALIFINFAGFFISLRSPEVYQIPIQNGSDTIRIMDENKVIDIIDNTCVTNEQYVINVNNAIHRGMASYLYTPDAPDTYHLRIPIYENYILFLSSYITPPYFDQSYFQNYEFLVNWGKAIERGVGYCSQQSIVVHDILKDKKNIQSDVIGLGDHVIVSVLVKPEKNEWWVLDPSYGVVIQQSLQEIHNDPHLIWNDYHNAGYTNATIEKLENSFQSPYGYYLSPLFYSYYEEISYYLIWIIPILFMAPYIYYRVKGSDKRK